MTLTKAVNLPMYLMAKMFMFTIGKFPKLLNYPLVHKWFCQAMTIRFKYGGYGNV